MRKSFTRLLGVFILFCMMALQAVAQPTVNKLNPVDGACQVARQGVFVITFNEDVSPGYNGTISLNNRMATEYIPIQLRSEFESSAGSGVFNAPAGALAPWKVTFSGKTVTIDFGYKLNEYQEYYITVSATAVKSKANPTKFFAGLTGSALDANVCQNDPNAQWDFTSKDETDPFAATLVPADEAKNIAQNTTCTVTFNENVTWLGGATGNNATLKTGDIAIYDCTDLGGIVGGDVIYDKPLSAVITGNALVITWPGLLPPTTDVYVRIKPGIIEDLRGNDFAGFNTNGQPYGTAYTTPTGAGKGWNFTTKDNTVPTIAFAWTSCFADANITITLNETGIVKAITRASVSSSIASYISLMQGTTAVPFTASLAEVSGTTVITVNPTPALISGQPYVITLLDGLWDSSDNAIVTKNATLTASDYTAPDLTKKDWKNPDGTTFNLNLISNEAATYYYIIVKASDLAKGTDAYYYKPENISASSQTYQSVILNIVNLIGTTPGTTTTYNWWGATGVTDDKTITVYGAGDIIAPANTELLEHVTMLPPSHGTDWVVLMFGADNSTCGNNTIGAGLSSTKNVSGPLYILPSTFDILPPVPTITAALVDPSDEVDGCSELPGTDKDSSPDVANGIQRNGPVYITFNEDVEDDDGSAFTGAEIAEAVSLNDGTPVLINTTTTTYDAAKKRFVIYPARPFASGGTLTVTLQSNRLQDAQDIERFGPNGTELLLPASATFCIESYRGPIVAVNPCAHSINFDRAGEIVISIKKAVYAPAIDGGGAISADSANVAFVGKYIQMRKHPAGEPTIATLNSGEIIYDGNANPKDSYFLSRVAFTVLYQGDSTLIKITPKSGFEWESETWYSIELERSIRTVDLLDLTDEELTGSACAISNYWSTFRSEDSRDPQLFFYEDDNFTVNGLGTVEPNLCNNLDVAANANILVSVDEWVKLGFGQVLGVTNLDPSDEIDDANALRRYFSLFDVTKADSITRISFDVKTFTLSASGDIAQFYIDPYRASGDAPNFVKGHNYQVCFIDNPNEVNAWADYTPGDALVDDNGNPVAVTCCTFTCPLDPVAPQCLLSATIEDKVLNNVTSSLKPVTDVPVNSDSIVNLTLNFGIVLNNPLLWSGSISIIDTLTGGVVQSANLNTGVLSTPGTSVSYVFNMHDALTGTSKWRDLRGYMIQFSGTNLINGLTTSCPFPSVVRPFNPIHTIDGSAPVITAFIPDVPGTPGVIGNCLTDKDQTDIIIVFDENVTKQAGKFLEIWRQSTNSVIRTIDAALANDTKGDTLTISKDIFKASLEYNESYYIHIPKGFVKNAVGLENGWITVDDSLTFCVGPNPAPQIVCGSFVPAHNSTTNNQKPNLEITFSEPVTPVAGFGLDIQIYRNGMNSPTTAFMRAPVTVFTKADADGKKWRFATSAAFNNANYTSYSQFEWDSCFDVNIAAGAFREVNGTQTTSALVTHPFPSVPASVCQWTFCIGDNTPPTVKFWPENNEVHVPTNAHLYAFISELPVMADGTPLNVTNVEGYFDVRVDGASIPFDVEFVGNDIPGGDNQKQRIRIVPRDPAGPDWSLTSTTPTMQAEKVYTLRFTNLAGNAELQDVNGNAVTNGEVTFTTEDITKPTFDVLPAVSGTPTSNKVTVTGSLNEAGKVRWLLVAHDGTYPTDVSYNNPIWASTYTSLGLARGEVATSGTGNDFTITAELLPDPTSTYDYDIIVFGADDEVDFFATDAQIMAEWPYTMNPSFETEVYRIKDLRPAPNRTVISPVVHFSFCDNDAPRLVGTIPARSPKNMSFPVEGRIELIFNENVQINDNNTTGYKIVLRDANNNLGVPLAYDVTKGDTIILYPLDSAKVDTEADAFMPWALAQSLGYKKDLDEQRDYYLEIDRWAISDDGGCTAPGNYWHEWVGKDSLQFRTEDNTPPCLAKWMPKACVQPEEDLVLTFNEANDMSVNSAITGDSAYIYIYKVGTIIPHERIPASTATKVKLSNGQYQFTIPTTYKYLSGESYKVRVPGNLFKDSYANVWVGDTCGCASPAKSGFSWTFDVRDYEDPIASWVLIQDFTYLNVAYQDPEYPQYAKVVEKKAGETEANVPTSSLLKIKFDEEVYLLDKDVTPNVWYKMNAPQVLDELVAAIHIKDVTNNKELFYDPNGIINSATDTAWIFAETVGTDYAVIRVFQAQEHWTPAMTTPWVKDAGFKSNTTYTVSLDAGLFADEEDCDNTRNIYDALPAPLGTFITRDDTPPTLTITDSKGAAICGGYCASQVAPIKLSFNNPVVKTPFAGIDYDALIWDSEDVNWWTYSNLPLTPADLINTADGDFLNFFYLGSTPSGSGTPVTLSNVTVDPNGKDILIYPSANLVSEGYYKIVFKGGSVKDQKRIPDGNEFLGDTCIFRVQDWIAPQALAFYPADNASGISNELAGTTSIPYTIGSSSYTATVTVGADSLAILFTEPIAKGTTTDDLILRRMNGQIIDEIGIEACKVDQTNKSVLVIPIDSLEEFTAYYVEVPAGFVTDADTLGCVPNNSVAIDPELYQFGWNFATADATPPIAIAYIPNHTDTVPRNSDLTIIFDENIFPSTSTDCELYIYHHDNVVGWVGNPSVDFGNVVEVIEFNVGGNPNYELSGTNIYNQLDRNVITFDPVNDFTRIGTYYIRVDGNCIADGQGNFWTGVHDSTTWRFTVTNDVTPILNTTNPEYDHANAAWQYVELPADPHGYVIADLSMTFVDEIYKQPLLVAPGQGKIKIFEYRYNPKTFKAEEKLWKEYDINDEAVVFNNDKVTINDVLLRDCINKQFGTYEECYYVYVDRGAVTNGYPGSKTFWAGIDNAFVWRFQTGCDDTFVCESEIVSPNVAADGEAALNLTIEDASTLVATFGEGIEAIPNAAGKIQLLDEEGLVAEIAVVDSMCEGNTLTVDISAFLKDETNYTVIVQANAFGDTSTVSTGITANCLGEWKFQTGDNTNPYPETMSFDGEDCVEAAPVFVMTFDETSGVAAGAGAIVVADTLGNAIAEIAIESVTIDVNTVTFSLPEGIVLPDTTVIEVTVPAGFLFDGDVTPLANDEFSWRFKTGENTAPTVEALTPEMAETADTVLAITFSEVVNAVAGKNITINGEAIDVEDFATEDNITYTYALTELESEATYAVVIEAGAFVDVNEGCEPNEIAETALSFKVDDISAPLATGSPTTATDYVGLELAINFTDAVTPATGNVVIYDAETDEVVETIPATSFKAASDNSVYTYAPKEVRFGEYYILIDAGAFVDESAAEVGQECPGIQDKEEWPLSIVDGIFVTCWNIIAPQRIPAGVDIPVNTTIVIDFCDERIKPGTKADRFLTVGDQSENRVEGVNYFNYLITEDMIEGNKLSVDVSGLKENTLYSIILAPGAITDEAGNEFIGITDANLWVFKTGDFSVPVVTVDAVTVMNIKGNSVAITSSELGTVYLAKDDVPANAAALLAAIAQDKAVAATVATAGSPVSVSVEGLKPGTYKAYGIDASGSIGVATNVVTVEEAPVMNFTAISAIQGSADASPLDGQKIRTKGVVTAIDKNGFYIQDAVAAWSGVYVYSTQFVGDVNIGGSFELVGTVDEYNGLTEIVSVETLVPITKLLTVTPIEVSASEAITEKYEGVLVQVIGRATSSYSGSADWAVKTANDKTIAVSNYIYGTYSSIVDHNYKVIGVVYQRNADYKVEPRMEGDITDLSAANGVDNNALSMKVYPNPFDKYISLSVSNDVKITKAVITNIAGQLVKEVINPNNTISTSELRSGVYFISLHTEDGVAKTERIIKR